MILLIAILTMIFSLNIKNARALDIEKPTNIVFDKSTNTLDLSSLTLRQKIAQMIIAEEEIENKQALQNMLIGGIYLWSYIDKQDYIDLVKTYQDETIIPFFISIDLEGCWNPFENFATLPEFKTIETTQQAYETGKWHGELLNEIGFNMNFAPVVDLNDTIWKCRSFPGSVEEISEKANAYIQGLEENNIIATSKHYPGKTLVGKDPHKHITYITIEQPDLVPFEINIKNNVSAIMITHTITKGIIDSESKPSVVSKPVVDSLRKQYDGLIITDEIRMLGLKDYYDNMEDMYIDLFRVDNDIILYFDRNPKKIYHLITTIENAVNNGQISEQRIDRSVTRILKAKGINVV